MENKYLKDRINIPDREANSWDLISFSTVCKENLKAKISEKEIQQIGVNMGFGNMVGNPLFRKSIEACTKVC